MGPKGRQWLANGGPKRACIWEVEVYAISSPFLAEIESEWWELRMLLSHTKSVQV
jgi:hypothetical protein